MRWLRDLFPTRWWTDDQPKPPVTMRHLRPMTAVVLFSGAAGGAELGLEMAGVKVIASAEADPDRAAAIEARWGHEVHGDVRRLHGAHFAGHLRPWLVWASPPCKGISEVNQKGKGVDDDGLFFEAIRVGCALRPDWLAFENVSRLKSRGADRVLRELEDRGYAWWALDLGSEMAGKDHERRRLFIVARRADAPDPQSGEGRPAGLSWAPAVSPSALRRKFGQPFRRRDGVGHLGAEALGRHVRAYDGVSDRVAEFARRAYGDAVDPIFPYLIARALVCWDSGISFADAADTMKGPHL